MGKNIKIFFDGGASPNPGKRECAVVSSDFSFKIHNGDLGYGTNNEAEWLGFLWAVEIAKPHADQPVEILGDSKLVISQAQGIWKCNLPSLIRYRDDFLKSKPLFKNLKLTHVRRHLNLAGIYIEELQGK